MAVLLVLAAIAAVAMPASADFTTYAQSQAHAILGDLNGDVTAYPAYTAAPKTGSAWQYACNSGWTSGFFPGYLWRVANATADMELAAAASKWAAGRAQEATNDKTHDIGFMLFYSFGLGIEYGGVTDPKYTSLLVQGAHTLASRYNPVVGMIRSWGPIDDNKQFEVIVDNLLNLELLFWAADKTGNSTLREIAIKHVDNTAKYWIRPDGSTFHLVVFNPETGAVISRSGTPQGYSQNSTWARGQSWAVYGFAMAYRYTKQARFLDYARNVTSYWIASIPDDLVPMWDFDAPASQPYKDTSSAAIVAAGLVELAQFTGHIPYHDLAVSTFSSLEATFKTNPTQSRALLTQNHHDCNADECTVIETDYYALEAYLRIQESLRRK
eukprot:m.77302 g.77302  ORF g.77302 m.77302 type:complete len:383 (-) comp8134_c0_seq1:2198-3346(-)